MYIRCGAEWLGRYLKCDSNLQSPNPDSSAFTTRPDTWYLSINVNVISVMQMRVLSSRPFLILLHQLSDSWEAWCHVIESTWLLPMKTRMLNICCDSVVAVVLVLAAIDRKWWGKHRKRKAATIDQKILPSHPQWCQFLLPFCVVINKYFHLISSDANFFFHFASLSINTFISSPVIPISSSIFRCFPYVSSKTMNGRQSSDIKMTSQTIQRH